MSLKSWWADQRSARQKRVETRQNAKTDRKRLKYEADITAYENGITPPQNGGITALSGVLSTAQSYFNRNKPGIASIDEDSGNKPMTYGIIGVVVAVIIGLFYLLTKKKKQRNYGVYY